MNFGDYNKLSNKVARLISAKAESIYSVLEEVRAVDLMF